jgi:hypothetical protein
MTAVEYLRTWVLLLICLHNLILAAVFLARVRDSRCLSGEARPREYASAETAIIPSHLVVGIIDLSRATRFRWSVSAQGICRLSFPADKHCPFREESADE